MRERAEDYDLGIYDQNGKELVVSQRRKKKTEKVTIKPSAGRYYIRVSGHEGAWSTKLPYHLKVGKHPNDGRNSG